MTVENKNYVTEGWKRIKNNLNMINSTYSKKQTRDVLLKDGYFETLFGRAKNRTLMKNDPKLYNSIYKHTDTLEKLFRDQQSYKGNYSFSKRIKFIVERNYDIKSFKCDCGLKLTWNTYCRKCPDYHRTALGKRHTDESKRKMRVSTLKYLERLNGKLAPRYNIDSIPLIEEYGKKHGYNFKHAENGGEYQVRPLGYFLDAYDSERNVVLEIDEKHHFAPNGSLKEDGITRQREIEELLGCEFIRIRV